MGSCVRLAIVRRDAHSYPGRVLTDSERDAAARLFAEHGFDEPLVVARVTSEDERIFVVPDDALAKLPEQRLTTDLQRALGRKVWIVGTSPAWADTEPLR
jgi:hypothetical protein